MGAAVRRAARVNSRLLLVTSGGGHLAHLWRLRSLWEGRDRVWVCLDQPDARMRLAGERVHWVHGPTTRSFSKLARNTLVARTILAKERPDQVLSTGAALAIPFFWLAPLFGVRSVFLEVIDRIDTASLTGRAVAPVASQIIVQWPEQLQHYPSAECVGTLW